MNIRRSMFNPISHPICFSDLQRVAPSAWVGHAPFAMLLIDLLRPEVVVELGTYLGTSYCSFCQAVDQLKLDTRCYAIDTWRGDEQSGFFGDEVLDDLRKHHDRLYGKFSRLIQSTFDEAIVHFEEKSIDLLHIDGFHTYEEVKKDFEKWLPKTSDRAVVLFHDINVKERDFGVWKFWEEIKSEYPSFDFLHSHGLGVLAVGKKTPQAVLEFIRFANEDTIGVQGFFYQLGFRFEIMLENQLLREHTSIRVQKNNEEQLHLLQAKEQEINKGKVELEANKKEVQTLLNRLDAKEQEVQRREKQVETEGTKLRKIIDELGGKEHELQSRENQVETDEKEIQRRSDELGAKEQEIQNRLESIRAKERESHNDVIRLETYKKELQFEADTTLAALKLERNSIETERRRLVTENQKFFRKNLELQQMLSEVADGKTDLIRSLQQRYNAIDSSEDTETVKLVIGIVTYNNSESQISSLFDSIELAAQTVSQMPLSFEIHVIDNGNETLLPDSGIKVAKHDSLGNIGFGSGMNHLMTQAFADSETHWFLCLNPDGILHYRALDELMRTVKSNPHSLVEARQFPEEHLKDYDPRTLETLWASGACLLIPRDIFEATKGFDSNMFMYLEDVDLSWRARSAGFSVKISPNALFGHSVLDRAVDQNTDRCFLLSGRYLAYKWKNKRFVEWTERELVTRGYYESSAVLPELPQQHGNFEFDTKIADFDHCFHFSPVRW